MLPALNSSFRRLLVGLGLVLFFLPKINLISVPGETTGIRLDDGLLAVIAGLLALAYLRRGKWTASTETSAFAAMLAGFAVSNAINIAAYGQSNVLYTIRYAEYFLFFYLGQYYRGSLSTLSYAILGINGIVMAFQAAGLLGGFASEGFSSIASFRPYGLTGGPWEIGAITNILFAVLVLTNSRVRPFLAFSLTLPIVLLCGARTAFVIHFLLLVYFSYIKSRHKALFLIRIGFIVMALTIGLLQIPTTLKERTANLLNRSNIDLAVEIYKTVEIRHPFAGFNYQVDEDSDLSWAIRANKWIYATKAWIESPHAWLIGLGPGIWGPALDGGWLRLLTETGAVGTLLFVFFFYRLSSSPGMRVVVWCLYLNMVFIDINIAYKVMSLVFFLGGYLSRQSTIHMHYAKLTSSNPISGAAATALPNYRIGIGS